MRRRRPGIGEPTVPRPSVLGFDAFEVDLEQRQLRRHGAIVTLQEKPFQLLEALLLRPDEIISREELHRTLWPDEQHLDFDAGLNVAARKLRQALGDSADEPRWLVTVPRRGYRLTAHPRPPVPARSKVLAPSLFDDRRRVGLVTALVVAVLGVILVIALIGARYERTQSEKVVRLAIMPFELAAGGEPMRRDLAPISEWLVAEMATQGGKQLEIIGPRSTARYEAKPFPDLRSLAADLGVDYVLNARSLEGEGADSLLVELIRLSDGAHPWVEFFEETEEWRVLAETIRNQVVEALGLEIRST